MQRRTLAFILAVIMIVSIWPVAAFADGPQKIGDSNVTWELINDNKTLVIGGTGAMPNCSSDASDQPWNAWSNNITSVLISAGITDIADYAFASCAALASVTVKAVTPPALGVGPFDNCSESLIIYVPTESVEEYQAAETWSNYISKIQEIPAYTIINSTPQIDANKNHGYITVDKVTAEAIEPVTVTVVPNKGYQLKALTVIPVVTVADILPEGFPAAESDVSGVPQSAWKSASEQQCYVSSDGSKLVFYNKDGNPVTSFGINTNAVLSAYDNDNYIYKNGTITITFSMKGEDGALNSITFENTANATWDATYEKPACVAAGTMVTMANGEQKAIEKIEIGDVIRTVDHETGTVSSAPVCYLWKSKNAVNAFTLTFEGSIEVTVIEEHGFYSLEEQKYVFINARNAAEYIGDHFYNADTDSWLALESIEMSQGYVDAYAIATSRQLNHLSNGMLSMCDGTVKKFVNIFEHDVPLKINAAQKEKDIMDNGGLTPLETVLKYKGFNEADYNDYNLQYLNVAIGKGFFTWERFKALSDYFEANNIYDSLPAPEKLKETEAPKMLLMSVSASKNMLGSAPEPATQGGIEIIANENGTYSFTMPASNVAISAAFEGKPAPVYYDDSYDTPAVSEYKMPFVDVAEGTYYYDAVKWAAENGVTGGVDAAHFAPQGITSRAQMVTFLWNAAGKPEPTLTECPFTDVKADKYYYKAVLWAYENGITGGTTATMFEPAKNVSRAQTIAFLWRYEGKPVVNYWMRMTDVASEKYYTEAVRWALAEKISGGTTATTFSPNNDCLRGQIVTFLYNNFVK